MRMISVYICKFVSNRNEEVEECSPPELKGHFCKASNEPNANIKMLLALDPAQGSPGNLR
jgi:hypothetical protein